LGFIDDAHSPFADHAEDPITADGDWRRRDSMIFVDAFGK
jgi:hypothetical protein